MLFIKKNIIYNDDLTSNANYLQNITTEKIKKITDEIVDNTNDQSNVQKICNNILINGKQYTIQDVSRDCINNIINKILLNKDSELFTNKYKTSMKDIINQRSYEFMLYIKPDQILNLCYHAFDPNGDIYIDNFLKNMSFISYSDIESFIQVVSNIMHTIKYTKINHYLQALYVLYLYCAKEYLQENSQLIKFFKEPILYKTYPIDEITRLIEETNKNINNSIIQNILQNIKKIINDKSQLKVLNQYLIKKFNLPSIISIKKIDRKRMIKTNKYNKIINWILIISMTIISFRIFYIIFQKILSFIKKKHKISKYNTTNIYKLTKNNTKPSNNKKKIKTTTIITKKIQPVNNNFTDYKSKSSKKIIINK